jgi:hypothetical protein
MDDDKKWKIDGNVFVEGMIHDIGLMYKKEE